MVHVRTLCQLINCFRNSSSIQIPVYRKVVGMVIAVGAVVLSRDTSRVYKWHSLWFLSSVCHYFWQGMIWGVFICNNKWVMSQIRDLFCCWGFSVYVPLSEFFPRKYLCHIRAGYVRKYTLTKEKYIRVKVIWHIRG